MTSNDYRQKIREELTPIGVSEDLRKKIKTVLSFKRSEEEWEWLLTQVKKKL